MPARQKIIIALLLMLSLALLVAFWRPNQAASQDLAMVLAFEADEAVPFPYVRDMLQPRDTLKHTVANFFAYDYYFYGFPHFAYSALALLPLQLTQQIDSTPLAMGVLRTVVSTLPMLAAIAVLVYLQTGFRDARALVLFALLAAVPAVVQNNFWWHPDSLAILLVTLTLFFLVRDDLRLGGNFYLAALACGVCAQTKLIGVYFFLAIALYLCWSWRGGLPLRRVLLAALGFLAVMVLAFFASNPILIYPGARAQYWQTLQAQSRLLADGYEVFYAPSLAHNLEILRQYYGGWLLLAATLATSLWAAWRGPRPLLHRLILAWVLPLSIFVFGFSFLKYQYWLPAALPLFSSLVIVLPGGWGELRSWWRQRRPWALAAFVLALFAAYSLVGFVQNSAQRYQLQMAREARNPALAFFAESEAALSALPASSYRVYADVNLYIPDRLGWRRTGRFETLDHAYFEDNKFDLVFISQTRIWDYLNEDVVGIDPVGFAASQAFYRQVNQGELDGYTLLLRSAPMGMVFVRDALYAQFFASNPPAQ